MLKYLIILALTAYVTILALLYIAQRRLMFFPDRVAATPAQVGFTRAEASTIKTGDGETILSWYVPPPPGKPLLLYFHGNAGQLAGRAARFDSLTKIGVGILAISYRGYAGSTGSPSEKGLIADARAAYDHARKKGHAPSDIIVVGESLGSGVAVALASEKQTGGLILEAPFSSTVAVAASTYWMFPIRYLMKDQFRSDLRVADIKAPLLIFHGDADPVMPIRFGKALFEKASEPKEFVTITGGGHQVMEVPEVLRKIQSWIENRQPKKLQ